MKRFISYEDDFLVSWQVYVSGQLEGELAATAWRYLHIRAYVPCRKLQLSRHLAEFWMVEPEVAFNDITDNMDLAEEFIKFCVKWALDNCADDVKFLNDMFDKGLIERLQGVLKDDFVRLPYTDGIKILEEAVAKGHKFEFPVYWFVDLASDTTFLSGKHFNVRDSD
jgi:asparaginyl-tRNA synthetase